MEEGRKKRIAKNTVMLYIRMALTMLVGLYTSRIVLNGLGITDYGIYNVVGGVVTMLGFFSSSITTSTQRFLNIGMEKRDKYSLETIFSTSVNIHAIIGIITVILLETIGLWFVIYKLQIPDAQRSAAIFVYHCSVISFFISIISTPYNAAIIAYERMSIFAIMSIIECALKLAVAFIILCSINNRLRLYAILLLIVTIIMRFTYSSYCSRKLPGIKYILTWQRKLIKEMASFSGWMIFGCISDLLGSQGVNLLINIFFGPALNAARAIGVQVQSAVSQFYTSFTVSVNPQITKSYAAKDYKYSNQLVFVASKMTFYLMLIIIIPFILRADEILILWLKQIPDYTPAIVSLILVEALIRSSYNPLAQIIQASGKIRIYQLSIALLFILNFIGTYLLFKSGQSVITAFILAVAIALTGLFTRLIVMKREIAFPMLEYLKDVSGRIYIVLIISFIINYYINKILSSDFVGILILILITLIINTFLMWLIGLTSFERDYTKNLISTIICKIKSRSK